MSAAWVDLDFLERALMRSLSALRLSVCRAALRVLPGLLPVARQMVEAEQDAERERWRTEIYAIFGEEPGCGI